MDGKGLWGMKYEDDGIINGLLLFRDEGIMYVFRCWLFEEGVEGGLL